jgi:CCR4-NOT transcription complex subunit 1
MRLPDPFTLTLKVELLPEMQLAPRSASEPDRLIPLEPVRVQLDHFLKTRQPSSLPTELVKRFFLIPSADGKGGTLNPSAIHALVLYVGASMIAKQGAAAAQASINSALGVSPVIELFLRLLTEMDNDGRYLLINAMANQLRYPNSHTHFYQSLLLAIFIEVKADNVREQITRVLLERLIVSRPHPWGLLVTFVELLKNTKYNFWQGHEFVHCSPEIERLFKSVTSSVGKDEMVAAR